MNIGVLDERGTSGTDKRAVLLPIDIKNITSSGHHVFVSKGMGEGVFVEDSDYKEAGATILTKPENILSQDLVVKLKAPSDNEILKMKGNILFCMLHLEQNPSRLELLHKQRIKPVAMELVVNEYDERLIDCTDMTGTQAMLAGFNLSIKSPDECKILILGYGRVSSAAIKIANKLGAKVKILRKEEYKNIEHHLKKKDILVNGISWPKYHRDKKDYVITKKMLKLLNKGGVVVDISVDFPNPIETCRPTFLNDPWYEVDGIKHICIYGYPSLVPISSSKRYSRQIGPLVVEIADNGIRKMSKPLRQAFIRTNP